MESFSNTRVSFFAWFSESFKLFKDLLSRESNLRDLESKNIEYAQLISRYQNINIASCNILEIGFGARPFQVASLSGIAKSVRGIDVDIPVLPGDNAGTYLSILKKNGVYRFLRTSVRSIFFDKNIYRQNSLLDVVKSAEFKNSLFQFTFGGDTNWPIDIANINFIFSEDVFEHIPRDMIKNGLKDLAHCINSECLVYLRPNVYTGITGGHDPDYFPQKLHEPLWQKKFRPWEHLYADCKMTTSTFLNKLNYGEYVDLFSVDFEILEIRHNSDRLGENYFDLAYPELFGVPEEELFMNQVGFLLRRRSSNSE